MKTIALLIGILIISSCYGPYVPEKPFLITGKNNYGTSSAGDLIMYRYVDKYGKEFHFKDRIDLYKVGDTIK